VSFDDLILSELRRVYDAEIDRASGVEPQDGESPEIEVKSIGGHLTMSNETAMEYGLIPDTRPPVHYSRWTRLRWRWQHRKYNARIRIGCWIAGISPDEHLW
jgi:hypothetical protein